MAQVYREIRHTAVNDPELIEDDRHIVSHYTTSGLHIAAHVVSLIGGAIISVLAIRFILSLLGANPANAFANFIYNLSHPFASPFFGLFNYQERIGVIRFEFETLVAMAFWAFVTWIIVRMLEIANHDTYSDV